MKTPKDNFSKQALGYKRFRPHYPMGFLEAILELVPQRQYLWDCGTGNGQVARALAPYFEQVYATDSSAQQLANALPANNIHYSQQAAEQTNFPAAHFDLITVAQAMHWFDFEAFYKEVERVAKQGAMLAIWGYGLLRVNPVVDALIDDYYSNVIASYWDEERQHIDAHYQTIPFPFQSIELPKGYAIEVQWTRDELEGYLNTWSSLQRYLQQHDHNPVTTLIKKIRPHWPSNTPKKVTFPLFYKLGQVK